MPTPATPGAPVNAEDGVPNPEAGVPPMGLRHILPQVVARAAGEGVPLDTPLGTTPTQTQAQGQTGLHPAPRGMHQFTFGYGPPPNVLNDPNARVVTLNFDILVNVPAPGQPGNADVPIPPLHDQNVPESTGPQATPTAPNDTNNTTGANSRTGPTRPLNGIPPPFMPFFTHVFGGPMPTGQSPPPWSASADMPQRREQKEWTLPPPPGLTLRQRIELKEREAGLRCSDISCGIGPTDEDPTPEVSSPDALKQISISRDFASGKEPVCEHRFHHACLVSAERVAGWGDRDGIVGEVEVACPVCRATGHVDKVEWEEGIRASMI